VRARVPHRAGEAVEGKAVVGGSAAFEAQGLGAKGGER
jgi:hypothetical protein